MWEIIIAGAAAIKVPGLVEAGVRSVGERLLGPVVDSWVQPMKSRAEQRARIAREVGEVGAKIVKEHPELFAADIQHLLIEGGARQDRVQTTFVKMLEHVAEAAGPVDAATAPPPPSDDWLNRWRRHVEDASSDDLQDAFARILAGEIIRPGAFSVSTLRAVSELTKDVAEDFQLVWAELISDYSVKYPTYGGGEGWLRLLRLREAGLVSPTDASIHRPPGAASKLWAFGNGPWLSIEVDPGVYSEVPIVNFSRTGLEIGSIMARPNIEANLRRLAAESPDKRGWQRATFVGLDGRREVVWAAQ